MLVPAVLVLDCEIQITCQRLAGEVVGRVSGLAPPGRAVVLAPQLQPTLHDTRDQADQRSAESMPRGDDKPACRRRVAPIPWCGSDELPRGVTGGRLAAADGQPLFHRGRPAAAVGGDGQGGAGLELEWIIQADESGL